MAGLSRVHGCRALIEFGTKSISLSMEKSHEQVVLKNPGRREFLRAVPAGGGRWIHDGQCVAFRAGCGGQARRRRERRCGCGRGNFQLFTAQEIQDDAKALPANPGNNNLVQGKNFTVVLTTEKAKSAKEFEWHEGRDHIFQILEGRQSTKWAERRRARTASAGRMACAGVGRATTLTLKKGDMLVIPRGTPHKRSTAGTVTFTLISPQGT